MSETQALAALIGGSAAILIIFGVVYWALITRPERPKQSAQQFGGTRLSTLDPLPDQSAMQRRNTATKTHNSQANKPT
jgi:hypothetical protein